MSSSNNISPPKDYYLKTKDWIYDYYKDSNLIDKHYKVIYPSQVLNLKKPKTIDDNIHEVKINKNKIQIALKLYDLLKILVINNDKLMTREVLFNQIWGTNACLETRTLDMHISSLRKILSENNSDVTIETIRGVGFILK